MRNNSVVHPILLLVASCLLLLAGCGTAPSSAASSEEAAARTAEEAALEATPEEQETDDAGQTAETSFPDPAGAATFSYAQYEEAALRAQQYWYADMTTGEMAHRYALVDSVAASVVPYESCIYNDQLLRIVSYGEEGERALDRIYAGTDLLVEVHFYVEYQPERYYQGPQYGDGLTAVYILVPTDTTQPCEVISGWYSSQIGEKMPRPGQTLMAEGLTIYQSRMVLHQCRAMAAAGLREFTSPADWTEEELYRYLYYRGQDFGIEADIWQNAMSAISYGNRILTIDFTAENDWSGNQRFLSAEWPGFTAENIEAYTANLGSGAVPGYNGLHTGWQISLDGDELVAKLNGDGGYSAQEYRFRLYDGFFAAWDGRTYCVEGRPLN